jgi:hypothetical protein
MCYIPTCVSVDSNNRICVRDSSKDNMTDAEFKNAMSGITMTRAITPITYYLTPQEVKCILGQNKIWSNAGDVEVEYGAYLETISGHIADLDDALDELNGTVVHNFLNNKAASSTIEGVTYTVNNDKTVAVNGVSSGWTGLLLDTFILPKGNYILKSGITVYPQNHNCYLEIKNGTQTITNTADTSRKSFSIQTDTQVSVRIHARPNSEVANVIAYPEIKYSEDTTSYRPYAFNSNKNLYDAISSLENSTIPTIISNPFETVSGSTATLNSSDCYLVVSGRIVELHIRFTMNSSTTGSVSLFDFKSEYQKYRPASYSTYNGVVASVYETWSGQGHGLFFVNSTYKIGVGAGLESGKGYVGFITYVI